MRKEQKAGGTASSSGLLFSNNGELVKSLPVCHSGQAERDPESSNISNGSPPSRGRRLDTGLRRYDEFDDNSRHCDTVFSRE
jgi:hypothetical protein